MAITNIEIVQDNIVGDCDLLSVASPLVYLVNATYTGAVPDVIYARLFDGATDLGYYKCLPWKDISSTVRQFWFRADEIIRQYVPLLEDVAQSDNTLIEIDGAVKSLTLKFCNEYRDDTGTCYKEGNMEGFEVIYSFYAVPGAITIDGVYYDLSFPVIGPTTLTNAFMIQRYIERLNLVAPNAIENSKVVVASSAYGYRITNNTTSDPDLIQLASIGGVTQEASFPVAVISAFTNFNAINAAGQFGDTEANLSVFNNEQQKQIGITGKHAYAYFYSADPTGTISVTESSNENYEMVATDEVVYVELAATQVSASVVKYEIADIGVGYIEFGASGVFETLSIKVDEILGTFSGSANKIELVIGHGALGGMRIIDLDALGVGTHDISLNTAYAITSVKIFIVGNIAEAKSISIDFVRLIATETTC